MGKIIKNGIAYGGTSSSAGNISYDNTSSGLVSSTVQNALTELKSLFDGDSTDNLNQFLTFNVTERDKGRITTPFTFKYLFIRNSGPDDCYISESDTFANVGEGKDGSMLLEAGSTIMLENISGIYGVCNQGETAWLSFCYQNNKNCPFDTY